MVLDLWSCSVVVEFIVQFTSPCAFSYGRKLWVGTQRISLGEQVEEIRFLHKEARLDRGRNLIIQESLGAMDPILF